MDGRISSICLKDNGQNVFWQITLEDDEGNFIGNFGNDKYCSDIDFRKQTFFMMRILGSWDLLKIDGKEKSFPILVDNEFSRINCIANYNGDYLKFDYITGEFSKGSDCDISQFYEQKITGLYSRSGVFATSIEDKFNHRAVTGDMAYLGFTPIYPNQEDEKLEIYGAKYFKQFVCGVLSLCDVKELIQTNNFPEVSIKFDSKGEIIGIGDRNNTEYLYITELGYELIDGNLKKR